MAIVPLKQTVYVRKLITDTSDGWDVETHGEPIEYKARATEQVEKVMNQLGEEVTSSVKILFDKLPDINYDDIVSFTNELGVKIERQPLSIRPIRMVNGKPTLTAVHL